MGDWVLSRDHLLNGMSQVFVRNIAVPFETTLRKRLSHDQSWCAEVFKPQMRLRLCLLGNETLLITSFLCMRYD